MGILRALATAVPRTMFMAIATGMRTRVRVSNWRVMESRRRVCRYSMSGVGRDAGGDGEDGHEGPRVSRTLRVDLAQREHAQEADHDERQQSAPDPDPRRRHLVLLPPGALRRLPECHVPGRSGLLASARPCCAGQRAAMSSPRLPSPSPHPPSRSSSWSSRSATGCCRDACGPGGCWLPASSSTPRGTWATCPPSCSSSWPTTASGWPRPGVATRGRRPRRPSSSTSSSWGSSSTSTWPSAAVPRSSPG